MNFKVKAVCIHLDECHERYRNMKLVGEKIEKVIPFEFSSATSYKDVSLCTKLDSENIDIQLEPDTTEYKVNVQYYKEVHVKGRNTGFLHDSKRYLMDQVEHFGRNHLRIYRNIPYAENVVALDHDDHNKKWITYNGQLLFFVEISNFRKYMTLGEIACVLSHVKVLQKLVHDGEYDAYLVLEDDVQLTSEHDLEAILHHLYLYKNCWDIAFLNEARFSTPNTLYPISPLLNILVNSSFTNACSYLITKKTAQYLLDTMNSFIDITMDDFLSRQQILKMVRVKNPVFTFDETSNISNIRNDHIESEAEKIFQKFNKNEL